MMANHLPLFDADASPSSSDDHRGFGTLHSSKGIFPMLAMGIEASISASASHTVLTQEFINPTAAPLIASYIFPLPPRAAVTSLEFEVDGRVIVAELKELQAARNEYVEAIAQGHRAAMAEERDADTFILRLGNIPSGEVATVRMTMSAPLLLNRATASYRFPLFISPRFLSEKTILELTQSQQEEHLERASELIEAAKFARLVHLFGLPHPVRLSIELTLDTGGPKMLDLESSIPTEALERSDEYAYLELATDTLPASDFILRWRLSEEEVVTSCIATQGEDDDGAYFQLTLTPPHHLTHQPRPRDIVFVIDRSGSMDGWRILAAKRALQNIVSTLTAHDRFHLIAFDNESAHHPPDRDAFASGFLDERERAIAIIEKWTPRGGTEMEQPLVDAAELLSEHATPARDAWLVLLTDGEVWSEDEILGKLTPKLGMTRVFAIGIAEAVNAGFLTRLANLGRGVYEQVESMARLTEVMDDLHHTIDTPLLTEIGFDANGVGLERESITPTRTDALFVGKPLLIQGRFSAATTPHPDATIEVRGKTADGAPWRTRVPISFGEHAALAPVWARGRLRDLDDRWVVSKKWALERESVALSLETGVLCRFTAFIAVDRSEKIERAEHEEREEVGAHRYLLVHIAGEHVGRMVPLEPLARVSFGRGHDNDIVFEGKSISRRHGIIENSMEGVFLEDLNSRNGTYVAGKNIDRIELSPGDLFYVGHSTLKLVRAADPAESYYHTRLGAPGTYETTRPNTLHSFHTPAPQRQAFHSVMYRSPPAAAAPAQAPPPSGSLRSTGQPPAGNITGLLEEVPLPDLLQLFSVSKKSGVLVIRGEDTGKIYLRQGRAVFATINDNQSLSPHKAFYRIIGWQAGSFSLEQTTHGAFENELDASIEELMMEGLRQLDELQKLGEDAPTPDAHLVDTDPPSSQLDALTPEQRDTYHLALEHGKVIDVLDSSERSDLELTKDIIALIRDGFLLVG